MDHESVQATALKAVFDLLLVFGFETFSLGPPHASENQDTHSQTEDVGVCVSVSPAGVFCAAPQETLVEGAGGELGEEEEEEEEEEGEKESNKITRRILTIMANFIDGEVRCSTIHTTSELCVCVCVCVCVVCVVCV